MTTTTPKLVTPAGIKRLIYPYMAEMRRRKIICLENRMEAAFDLLAKEIISSLHGVVSKLRGEIDRAYPRKLDKVTVDVDLVAPLLRKVSHETLFDILSPREFDDDPEVVRLRKLVENGLECAIEKRLPGVFVTDKSRGRRNVTLGLSDIAFDTAIQEEEKVVRVFVTITIKARVVRKPRRMGRVKG